jgi:hypothetical protein
MERIRSRLRIVQFLGATHSRLVWGSKRPALHVCAGSAEWQKIPENYHDCYDANGMICFKSAQGICPPVVGFRHGIFGTQGVRAMLTLHKLLCTKQSLDHAMVRSRPENLRKVQKACTRMRQ